MKKYVVLENLQVPNRGFRFWSLNTANNTHSAKGELWYKEILFTDSEEEAIAESRKVNYDAIPSWRELYEHHLEEKDDKTKKQSH